MKKLFVFLLSLQSTFLFASDWSAPGSGNWTNIGNWNPTVPNGIDAVAVFGSGPLISPSVSLDANITIGSITFDFNLKYTITLVPGNTLTFDVSTGSALLDITSNCTNGAQINCPISLADPMIIDQAASTPFIVLNSISEIGSQSLTKTSAGTLVLNAANSYSGGTFIQQGIVSVGADSRLGAASGALNIQNGTLRCTGNIPASSPSIRSGSFTGSGTIDTQGNTVALAGSFDGNGSLTKLGVGTLILTGNNTFTGSITIGAGTLQGNSSSLPGDISVGGSLSFDQTFSGTYSGMLSGAGPVTKTGAGVLQITGTSTGFTGATLVSQGELKVNGSIASSAVTVSSGASLSGVGVVGATTVNAGASISPGNSIGTLTVMGPLFLMPGSSTNIEVSPTAADLIVVGGTATLTGANLLLSAESGFYGFEKTYTILTSTTLGGTTFAPLAFSDPNFIPSLSYTSTDVLLTITVPHPFVSLPYYGTNVQNVINNLDALFAAGELSADLIGVVGSFAGQSLDAINEALDEFHPAPYSAFNELQVENSSQLVSLFRRFPTLCGCDCPDRIWAKPFANGFGLKSGDEQVGANAVSGGIALGWDKVIAEEFAIGVGAAWNRNHLKWHEHRGTIDSNGVYGACYGNFWRGDWYLGMTFLGGVDFCDASRHIALFTTERVAKADYNTLDLVGQMTFAYFFGLSDAQISPYANVDFLYFQNGSFHEHGAGGLNLTVNSQASTTFRSELGVSFDGQYDKKCFCVSPSLSMAWVYMQPIQRQNFRAHFEGAPILFTAKGWDQTWNLLASEIGLTMSSGCFTFDLEYNFEVAVNDPFLWDQHGSVTFSWKW